jgi:hypothetical protein
MNNNLTINNMGNTTQHIRQSNTQNGTIIQQQQQQPMTSGMMTTPTSIVRVNQPQSMQQQQHQITHNQGQFAPQTLWTNNISPTAQHQFTLQKQTQQSPIVQYATVKNGMRNTFFVFKNFVYLLFRTICTWYTATIIYITN